MQKQKDIDHFQTFWRNKQIREYVSYQIREADLHIYRIVKDYVCLIYQTNTSKDSLQSLILMIVLGKGYPVTPPQVFILEVFTKISIRGYRDYLEDVLEEKWNFKYTLKTIKASIPDFILKLQKYDNSLCELQSLGKYHTERIYSFELLKDLSEYGPFIAFETTEHSVALEVIAITQTHFVIFKPILQPYFKNNKLNVPKQSQIQDMRISFVIEIQGLLQIHHNRVEKHEYTFIFNGEEVTNRSIVRVKKKLKITKSTQMMQSLLKQLKHFKGCIDLECNSPQCNSEQQKRLLTEVKQAQKWMRHHFNSHTVNQLNNYYEKMVEFYSNLDLPYQEIFIRKIYKLFSREDVKLIMHESPKHKKI